MNNENIEKLDSKNLETRKDVLYSILNYLESLKNHIFDELTYLRIKSTIDKMIYDLRYNIKHKGKQQAVFLVGDNIKNIVKVSDIDIVDEKDISIRYGMLEVENMINQFVDYIIKKNNSTNLKEEDFLKLLVIAGQLNDIIERHYMKRF